jgi:hypothetical protein
MGGPRQPDRPFRFVWIMIWIAAIGLAALVDLAFMVRWPDHFVREDSAAFSAKRNETSGFPESVGYPPPHFQADAKLPIKGFLQRRGTRGE